MSNLAIRLSAEPQRSRAAGDISASYDGIGTALSNPIRMIFVQNLTDVLLQFSLDGINDHFPLPPNGYMILDITSNKSNTGGIYCISAGTRIYVKRIGVPATGSVYVSTFYGSEI